MNMIEMVERLKSAHLRNERTIWIRQPSDRSTAENLTLFLDGELYRDGVGATSVLDNLQGVLADSWFVFVSMESVEARWVECPCHPPFAQFIVDELLPWLEARHPDLRSIRRRTLVGLSYTGLAAAFVTKEYPGVFSRVISQSGSFWWADCRLVQEFRSAPRLPTEFYLDVGTYEVHENVRHRADVLQVTSQLEAVRQFRDVLLLKGHRVRYLEFEGGHDFAAGRQTLPKALEWALPRAADRAVRKSARPSRRGGASIRPD